jgi:hypothetical protein
VETAGGAADPDGAEDPEDGEPLPPQPAITIAAAAAARATIQPARPERPSVNGGLCGMGRSITRKTGSSAAFPTMAHNSPPFLRRAEICVHGFCIRS